MSLLSNCKEFAQLGIGNSQGLVKVVLCRSKIPLNLPLQRETFNVSLGMVEIPRPFDRAQGMLQAKRKSVMPAQAGIQVRLREGTT